MELVKKQIQLQCTEEEKCNIEETLESIRALRDILLEENLYFFDNFYGKDINNDVLTYLIGALHRLSDAMSNDDRFELKEYA